VTVNNSVSKYIKHKYHVQMQTLAQMFGAEIGYTKMQHSRKVLLQQLPPYRLHVPAASQDISSVMERHIINQPGLDLSVG